MTSVVREAKPQGKIAKVERSQSATEFIGKAWKNTAKSAKNKGTEFLRVTFDRDISSLAVNPATDSFVLWPNQKREGKNDADYRVMLSSRAAQQ